jgi:hypothetical protein
MSRALKYFSGFKYQLAESFWEEYTIYPDDSISTTFITLSGTGLLVLKKGFAWDGPSGPTIDTPDSLKGSAVHDAYCRLMSWGLLSRSWKDKADAIARDVWIESGMSPNRADLWFRVLQKMDFYVQPDSAREILEAP